jgi:hypothetical protein
MDELIGVFNYDHFVSSIELPKTLIDGNGLLCFVMVPKASIKVFYKSIELTNRQTNWMVFKYDHFVSSIELPKTLIDGSE